MKVDWDELKRLQGSDDPNNWMLFARILDKAWPSILAERETAQTIPPGYALVPVEQVKDAERLDFLDGNLKFSMGWQVNKAPVGNVGVHSIIFAGRLPVTIREAIDKAMLTAAAKGE